MSLADATRLEEQLAVPQASPLVAAKELFANLSFILLVVYFTLPVLTGWVVRDWMPSILKKEFGIGQGQAEVAATIYWQVAAIVGAVAGGSMDAAQSAWADRCECHRRESIVPAIFGIVSHCATVSSQSPSALLCLPVSDFMRAVFAAAMVKPLRASAKPYYLPRMKKLIAFCAELQIAAKGGTFFLSCRDAGVLLEEDHRKVLGWLKKLASGGVVTRISTGSL